MKHVQRFTVGIKNGLTQEDIDFLANIANAEERDPREVAASILHYAIQRLQFTKQTTKDIAREAQMFQTVLGQTVYPTKGVTNMKFTAVFANGMRIISVLAKNETEARKEITEQLSRPGRTSYLSAWKKDGSLIIDTTKENNMDNEKYYQYLDELQDSGVTNMFCASSYLVEEFGLELKEARRILAEWIRKQK